LTKKTKNYIFRLSVGGVSSLKLQWHGTCGGILTINTDSLNCSPFQNIDGKGSPKFVDCNCYESFLESRFTQFNCLLFDEQDIIEKQTEDICIVSVNDETGTVDFNAEFRSPIILVLEKRTNETDDNANKIDVTYFDTSCQPGGFPIYPGYGKFSSSCPNEVSNNKDTQCERLVFS